MSFLNDNFISEFLVTVLNFVETILNDYSLTIILMTIVIRLILLPLDLRQKKSSRMMANLGPELEKLKKRYANDPQQLNAKTQQLYKKNGVKPLAGCLPMLIQLPLLFAFFGALRVIASEQTLGLLLNATHAGAENVTMPAWLWVHNFWQPDSGLSPIFPVANDFLLFIQQNLSYISPETLSVMQAQDIISISNAIPVVNETVYNSLTTGMVNAAGLQGLNNGWFGLPILAGVSLFFQQKLMNRMNPQLSQNGSSGKFMLWFFPLFSIYICATSTTAFAVYWLASNVYAIVQNIIIDAVFRAKEKKKKEQVLVSPASGGAK